MYVYNFLIALAGGHYAINCLTLSLSLNIKNIITYSKAPKCNYFLYRLYRSSNRICEIRPQNPKVELKGTCPLHTSQVKIHSGHQRVIQFLECTLAEQFLSRQYLLKQDKTIHVQVGFKCSFSTKCVKSIFIFSLEHSVCIQSHFIRFSKFQIVCNITLVSWTGKHFLTQKTEETSVFGIP